MSQLHLSSTLNRDGSITSSWSAVPGAVRYHAYMLIVGEDHAVYNEKNLTVTSYTTKSGLEANKRYKVTVVAYGSHSSLDSEAVTTLIPIGFYDTEPLAVPQNVKAVADTSSVTVSYSAVSRATGYDILFDNTVYSVTSTSKRFTGLYPGTSHTYAVRAKNQTKTGAYSSTQSITTQEQRLTVPTNIRKTATENSATISWGAVNGASGYDIKFFGTVYSVSGTSKTFTGLVDGRSHAFSIRAKNGSTVSAYSSEMTVVTPPKAPTGVGAESTGNSVTVNWNSVAGASGYIVRFNNRDYHVSAPNTSQTITGLAQKTSYSYQICCKSTDGTGSFSISRSIMTKERPPAVPSNIRKSVTGYSATISWNAVSGASGYTLVFDGTSYNVGGTSKEITGLKADRSYSFKICAKNSGGAGNYSSEMTVRTAPAAPASISASSTETSVTVSWGAVEGAAGYTVYFNGVEYEIKAPAVSRTFTGLSGDTAYRYKVCSRSVDGKGVFCGEKTIRTQKRGLSVPTGISHKSTDNSVTISWNAVPGASGYDVMFGGRTYEVNKTSKEFSGLAEDRQYYYKIRSRVASGAYGDYSESKMVRTTPKAPAYVSVTASENSVTLSWGAVKGAVSYDLLFNGKVYHVSGTSQTITGLGANASYSYQLRVNTEDGSSAYGSAKTVGTAPNPPSAVTVNASKNSVVLKWNAVTGAASYDILFDGSKYKVYGTYHEVRNLSPDTSYTYQIRSNNANGSSSYSTVKTVSTLPNPPAVPANVNASSTKDSVTVTWNAVQGAASYDVEIGNNIYNVTGTSKTATGLKSDTSYSYRVRANNAGGSSTYSGYRSIKTLMAPPAVPTNVRATPSSYSVMVSWNVAAGASSYELRFNGSVYNVYGTYYTVTGLTPSTGYSYQVRAKNAAGTSAYSSAARVTTLVRPPAVPSNIIATADTDSVTISWNAVSGATSYNVMFDGSVYNNGTAVSRTFKGLKPDTGYTYAVSAFNAGGSSGYSSQITIRTRKPVPETPPEVDAIAAIDSVIVRWKPVEYAESYDILFDSNNYHVTENGTITYFSQTPGVERIGEAVGEWMYKIFTGLGPNTRHGYSLRANNVEGSGKYTQEQYITTEIWKTSGLAPGSGRKTYPDGKKSYMGNDPVNALTGAFLWSYTWLEDYGKDRLHFTTMYDSQREEGQGVLGRKWTHSLNYLLRMDDEYAYFYTPYDDVTAFGRNSEDGSFQPVEGVVPSYTMEANEDGSYSVRALDGIEYVFDEYLCLNRIMENGLVSFRFQADDVGQITHIEGRHGAGMDIVYTDGFAASVKDAMGNVVSFAYENGRLMEITGPDGGKMAFTYDDACNLLVISDFAGEVYLTNNYDMYGRITEQFTAGRGRSCVAYDEENHITRFTDETGNVTGYTYDEMGHVTDVALSGTQIHNSYNEKGQLTEQMDALGNLTRMEYDDYGRMNRVIFPDDTEESVTYNERNQPSRVVGRDGSVKLYQYDERNNLIEMQDERGNKNSYTYDENDNLISFTDRSGNVWTYVYDDGNHLAQAVDPEGNISLYTHDAVGRMTSYTSPVGRTVSYRYSPAGNLLSIEDADGEIIFAYNENGNKTGITDRLGNQQRLEYNEMGQLSLATDYLGNEYHFTYDEKGNLTSETDPLGFRISRTYDAFGNRMSQTDKNGGVTHYSFDAANRLIQVCDAAGGTISYTYDCMGQVTVITDQLSRRRTYTYDQAGRVLSETDALGHSADYTYDEAGNLLTRTDEDGNITSYTYDEENRLKSIQTEDGMTIFTYDSLGRIASVTDTDGYVEDAQYDEDGMLTAVVDKEDRKTSYVYDSMGRIAEETAPDGGKTAYVYDKNGNCIQKTDAEGYVSSYEYDANNRLVKVTDPLGQESILAYDARGQLVSVTDANGGIRRYSYDGNGNLTAEMNQVGGRKTYVYDSLNRLTGGTDEEGNTWSCTYDAVGNRTSYTDANGNCRTYEYDANNRLIKVTDQNEDGLTLVYTNAGRIASVTDMEGAVTSYQYDAMGRMTSISDALGHSMSLTYDSKGRVLTRTDANGNTTEYVYSPQGNLLKVIDAEGGITVCTYNELGQVQTKEDSLGNKITYSYNLLGQVTSMTDALGNTTAFTYTADGHIAAVTNAEGGITRYTYDACGNLTKTEDTMGKVISYEYDAMNNRIKECLSEAGEQSCITLYQYDKKGRVIKEIDPMLEEKTYGYDGNGNMVSVTDEEKRETVVTYDLNNNPVSMTYSDGRTAAFRYNKRGELVEMQDWNGTTVMERDILGRLTGVTDYNGRVTGFHYDAVGNRTGIQYPDGSAAAYAYDRNNRLLKVTESVDISVENAEEIVTQYTYDAAGNITSFNQPGSTASYTYNANRQPVKASYRFGETVFMEEDITYDVMGRITASSRIGSSPEFARTAAYAYDAAGQLISYQNGDVLEAYTYDALGNRITRSMDGIQKAACQYNALNQLTAMVKDGVAYSFGYDKCGHLTEERRDDVPVRQYAYDTAGLLALGRNMESGEETSYVYNALRMRVKNTQKLVSADDFYKREMQYVPDFLSAANNELMTYEADASAARTVFGYNHHRLSQTTPSGQTFFQSDLYGSPLFAADTQGILQHCAERGIWGDLKSGTDVPPDLAENMRFTSYRYDSVIGKHFAHARFYDSANGRMLSKDPVKRGLNQYRYCDNDPADYTDPTREIAHIAWAAGLGGIFGFGGGFLESAFSQTMDGGDIDWMEALGSGVKGAITGATQAGLLASGAGFPTALFANALAGTAGSAAEQYIGGGRIDPEKSILGGLSNAVSNAIYGTDPLGSGKEAFLRGMGDGAANAALSYLFDTTGNKGVSRAGALPGLAGALFSPYEALRDPRRGCGSISPFVPIPGYGPAKGYQYEMPGAGSGNANTPKKFSICDFLLETVIGGITGGLSSVAFYGAGKGIERLMDGLRPGRGSETLGNIEEVRYREGKVIKPMEVTYDMRLNPEEYAHAVVDKYGINLSGSGQKINIKFDPYHIKGPGVSRKIDPTNIILGPQAFMSEEELARTISHELNHARSWLKEGGAPEDIARAAENALGDFINGGR